MSFMSPPSPPPLPSVPQPPAAPPMFGQPAQAGPKPGRKSTVPTFLGTALTPNPTNTGMKTLMGT